MDYHMNTRELLEIPEDAFVVGMVGRLAEQKAPDVFVKAAKRIKEKIPKAFFLIVGDKRHLNIGYIRNGIDLNRLNINEEITRSELGIGTEDIVLSFCGYLSKRKNASYLINAIKKISRKPNVKIRKIIWFCCIIYIYV